MSILNNAINSIIVGVEDFNMGEEKRLISSTRNIFAGILLLFKHKLVELSPSNSDEVLIKQRIIPSMSSNNELIWSGKGNKTVDVYQIKERFNSLNIEVDWKRLDKINDYRNNIEHYYSTESVDAVRTLISNSFLVIRDFISSHLDEDPKELLGEKVWSELVKINEVYEAEKKDCLNELEALEWIDDVAFCTVSEYRCENCHSDLITVDEEENIKCKSCDEIYEQDYLIEKSLIQKYGYYDYRNGEEPSLIECPSCQKESYLIFENKCLICGEVLETECDICGMDIPVSEMNDSGSCGYCLYKHDKYFNEDD